MLLEEGEKLHREGMGMETTSSPLAQAGCKLNVALSLPSPPRSAQEQRSPREERMEGATRVEVRTGAQGQELGRMKQLNLLLMGNLAPK